MPRQRVAHLLLAALIAVLLFVAAAPVRAQTRGASRSIERRVALVIGNSRYRHVPRLVNPLNDATLIAHTLEGLGFVLVGGKAQIDLDKPAFDRAIRKFGEELRRGGVGLFYYAGHGVQINGENYLVPVSANVESEADVDFELVSASIVLHQMQIAGTHLNLILLDACRNNPFGGRGVRSAVGGLAQMRAPEGTLIAYATQPGQIALDGAGGNSPYATALAEVLPRPGLDVFGTFNAVGIEVKRDTGGVQEPWVSSSPIDGEFYFAGPPPGGKGPGVAAAALPKDAQFELTFWRSIENSANPADYRAYLQAYPEGHFAALARARAGKAPAAPQEMAHQEATLAAPPVAPVPAAQPAHEQVARLPPGRNSDLSRTRAAAKSRDIAWPEDEVMIDPPAAGVPPSIVPFLGAWASEKDAHVRQVILIVHTVEPDGHVLCDYLLGPIRRFLKYALPPGRYPIQGRVEDHMIVMRTPKTVHKIVPQRDGSMTDYITFRADGHTMVNILRRVE